MNEMESVREKILLRVVIYLRLSNEDRDKINKDDDSESIKNQRNMLLDYIDKNPQFMLVDEYCDEDLSVYMIMLILTIAVIKNQDK